MIDKMLNFLYPLLSMGMEWSPSTVGVKITVKIFVFLVSPVNSQLTPQQITFINKTPANMNQS